MITRVNPFSQIGIPWMPCLRLAVYLNYRQSTMNKAGSNSGHLTSNFEIQYFHIFYFVLVLKTIWKDCKEETQMVLPYEPSYGSWNIAKNCVFCNFAKITTMKTKFPYEIMSLEAKNAKKRTYIQLPHLEMIPIELLELINLGTRGRHVISTVL